MLYGIFFEEINCAGDGGLYAEMVRNRSFEESDKPDHWTLLNERGATGTMQLDAAFSVTASNRHSLKVVAESTAGRTAVANSGYWGIALKKGETYELELQARSDKPGLPLTVTLENAQGTALAQETIKKLSTQWERYSLSLKAKATESKARLVIAPTRPGTVWLDLVSLFPNRTWKDSRLRPDLAGALDALRPAFVRFPGGCWVEGDNISLAYRWKQTLGPIENRRTHYNIWQYHSTHGLGYHEYLQMCEDLNAEPLFVVNCGMSHKENVPMNEIDPWVQDALDAIEYANGSIDTRWGSLRAKYGHPKPFNLKYVEIGNENGGPAYSERYAVFYKAIKSAHPGMHLVANDWGGVPMSAPIEIVDEHYYSTPQFFVQNAEKYDKYPRNGPKIYVGEYAVTQNSGQGNLRGALGEAAFMMGMERNSDVVIMSSYAPLFANVNYKKWNPDLINFDNHRVYGTPSYYVQKLFAENRPDVVLKTKVECAEGVQELPRGAIGLGTWNTQAEFKDIKVESDGKVLFSAQEPKDLEGWKPLGGSWEAKDGVIRQTGPGDNRRITVGDSNWKDYVLTLKARKLGGDEGFLIMFHVEDPQNWLWLNLGGWNNTSHAIENCVDGGKATLGRGLPGKIETGRWYDVKVELKGLEVRCYLDGKLIQEQKMPPPVRMLHAIAGRINNTGEILLKVANVYGEAVEADVTLEGLKSVSSSGIVTVLTSASGADENSLDQPRKVFPTTRKLKGLGPQFKHSFPANSLTVFRLNAAR
jgi:alpha-L-arabinofuranosidase